jgi:hypothetical protein
MVIHNVRRRAMPDGKATGAAHSGKGAAGRPETPPPIRISGPGSKKRFRPSSSPSKRLRYTAQLLGRSGPASPATTIQITKHIPRTKPLQLVFGWFSRAGTAGLLPLHVDDRTQT